jgi:hypothetical protein
VRCQGKEEEASTRMTLSAPAVANRPDEGCKSTDMILSVLCHDSMGVSTFIVSFLKPPQPALLYHTRRPNTHTHTPAPTHTHTHTHTRARAPQHTHIFVRMHTRESCLQGLQHEIDCSLQ